MIRETHALLSEESLEHNFHLLRKLLPKDAFFCPMVKCNAYGHGDIKVAQLLERWGCSQVGVVSVEEAMALRQAGVRLDILIFGHVAQNGWDQVEQGDFIPVVGSLRELEQMLLVGGNVRFHLKFNTGLNRLGIRAEDLAATQELLKKTKSQRLEGLCTHLIQSWDIGSGEVSSEQIQQFRALAEEFKASAPATHVLNSMGLFKSHEHHPEQLGFLGARPGLALYGVKLPGFGLAADGLKPVMRLVSKIVHVQKVRQGEVVSYDGLWQAPRDSVIGIVPAGYGDGLPWSLQGKGHVRYMGNQLPIVGKICMDHIMVDMTEHLGEPLFNEEVEIFGEEISVARVAENAGTIPYEILAGLHGRVERHWQRKSP